ncbi:MAG: response regulator [Ferruginibacter sp.]
MSVKTLIVDDDKAVQFFHKMTVKESKLSDEPLIFVDGQEALNYLNLNFKESDYYLVLLDINMPVMDGWEFLKIVSDKPYAQHVFFAMVTSSVDKADKEKAVAYSQVIDFVEKPISFEGCKKIRLMSQIAEHMDN